MFTLPNVAFFTFCVNILMVSIASGTDEDSADPIVWQGGWGVGADIQNLNLVVGPLRLDWILTGGSAVYLCYLYEIQEQLC
jgi:hypothetical protein